MDKDDKRKEPDWLTALKSVREKSDDPVVDGLVAIGQHTIEASNTLDARIDKADERADEARRLQAKGQEAVENQMEAGFRTVSERIDAMSKRNILHSTTGTGGAVFSQVDRLAAVIPDQNKNLIYEAEIKIAREQRANPGGVASKGLFSDPQFHAASELWFKTSLKLQLPRYFGGEQSELRQQLDKINAAFNDVYPQQKAAYAEGAASTGGDLVPVIVAADILRIVQDSNVVVSRARHIPMTSDTLHIPNEATGVTVNFVGEASTLTAGEGTFGVNILTAKKLAGRAAASIEVVDDAVVGIVPYIQMVMAEKIGKTLDTEALEGDGTNFTGINAESGINTVATTTTDGEQIVYADLVNAVYAADESSVEDGAAWFMHRKIFATVVGLVDSQGRPIFQPAVESKSPGTILGFPVYTTSAISTTVTRGATGGTSNVYFGDPRRMIFGDSRQLRFDVTETGPGWQFFQVDMRLVGRWGFTVATPAAFSRIVGATQL